MPIGRDGTKAYPPRIARTHKGICGICFQDIIAGTAYDIMGGTNTKSQRLVHYNCYKPANAPTFEELQRITMKGETEMEYTKGEWEFAEGR